MRDVGEEEGGSRNPSYPRWNHAAIRWARRDESICDACRDSVEQALMDPNIVSSDLPLDDWYGSVMGIIQQVASHHFGVKSTSPRRHWMIPEAWNDIVTRQAQVSKLVEKKGVPSYKSMILGALFFACGTSLLAWGFWKGGFVPVCRKAKARHAASTCAQLEETLRAQDHRAAWEHCRLFAGHSRRSVKPRAVPPGKGSGSRGA